MGGAEKFFRACRTGNVVVLRQLLEAGMDVDARDPDVLTGLIWAGRKGKLESAAILLEHGANIDLGDQRGRTALFHAAAFGRCEFVLYLAARGAAVNVLDCHGYTPLDIAIMEYPRPGPMVPTLETLGAVRGDALR